MLDPQSKAFIAYFVRARARTAGMVLLLLLAGVAEGIGIGTLLPLLETAMGADGWSGLALTRLVTRLVRRLGIEPTPGGLLGLIVVALTVKAACRWLAMKQVGYGVARVAGELRLRLIRSLLAARWPYFADQPIGHFANALGVEAYRASFAYRRACAALAAAIQVGVYSLLLLLLSWKLLLFSVLLGGAGVVVLGGFVRAGRRAGEAQTAATRSLVGRLVDLLQSLKPIKGMAREGRFLQVLEREAARLEAAERRQVLANESLQSFQEPVLAAMLALGVYAAVVWGSEPLPALLVAAFLLQRTASRVHQLQAEYQGMASGENAFWSLDAQTRQAEAAAERVAGEPPPPLADGIELDGVSFAYDGGVEVLARVSLRIPAGALVLLVGRSGAGKTTLLDLVLGLRRPTAGELLVDGVPLERIDLSAWRRRIGYVPQETVLLHDTVAGNLDPGGASAGREALERALRAAGAWEFVARLPEGLDTVVGERGWRLSGGERQRLAIARALVGAPKLLVLDEPITAMDPETAAGVRATLEALRGTVTVLVVSHEPVLEDVADLVYEVDGGRVRERAGMRRAGIRSGG